MDSTFIPDDKWEAFQTKKLRKEQREERLIDLNKKKMGSLKKKFEKQKIKIEETLENLDEIFA